MTASPAGPGCVLTELQEASTLISTPHRSTRTFAADIPIIGDCAYVLEDLIKHLEGAAGAVQIDKPALEALVERASTAGANRKSLTYRPVDADVIMPQYALERLHDDHLKDHDDVYITTEVGQHQMWAAQFIDFEKPNHWMTSGGLGTMGYGLPAAMGVQVAHPDALVIDVAGEASVLMNIQEMSTLAQYRLPVKIFILNNRWMGMVRQWQEFFFGGRYSESYMDSLPDFVKLAESFGALGLRASKPGDVDDVIKEMIETDRPVIVDVEVDPDENVYPMIPAGAAHNQITMSPGDEVELDDATKDEGMVLV